MRFSWILALVAIIGIAGAAAIVSEDVDAATGDVLQSGSCSASGSSVTFQIISLDDTDAHVKLALDGTGSTANYGYVGSTTSTPWRDYLGKITEITIGAGVTGLGNQVFKYLTSITTFTIPATVTTIKEGIFYKCSGLQEILVDSGNPNYISIDGVLYTADGTTLVQYPMGKEGDEFDVPEGVTTLMNFAFADTALQNITIPDTMINLGGATFTEANKLRTISLPDSITTIGSSCFEHCSVLELDHLPSALTSGGTRMFYYCSKITFSVIPDGVTDFQEWGRAFERCYGLTVLYFPSGSSGTPGYAFTDCTNLREVHIPDNYTTISIETFKGCSGLTSITIPDSVRTISSGAFEGTSITSAEMPYIRWTYSSNMRSLINLTYTSIASNVDYEHYKTYSPQYLSRNTIQTIEFKTGIIPRDSLYMQTEPLSKIVMDPYSDIGVYIDGALATDELLSAGSAAAIVRFADKTGLNVIEEGTVELAGTTGAYTTNDAAVSGQTMDAEIIIYTKGWPGTQNPYSGLYSAIPLMAIIAIVMAIVGTMIIRRD